jgi:hypothetical protein
MIGGKAPSEYLVQLQKHSSVQLDDAGMDAILKTHYINPTTLRQDDFEGFITSRQCMMLAKIEAAMGKPIFATVDDSISSNVVDGEE